MERATESAALPGVGSAVWLAGRWRLDRIIHDRRQRRTGRVAGCLTVTPDAADAATLWLQEEGEMVLGGQRYPVSRRVAWQAIGPGCFDVTFEDGRPFHSLRFTDGRAVAHHDCGADRYDVQYRAGAHGWMSCWRVTGPAKDYRMLTRHLRA